MRACASLGFVRFLQAAAGSLAVHANNLCAFYRSKDANEYVLRPLDILVSAKKVVKTTSCYTS